MTHMGYRRLTRRRRTIAGSSELWLAGDHLLLAVRHWYTERYHRFRLTDIQSIVVSERSSFLPYQLICLAITATAFLLTIIPPWGWKTVASPLLLIVIAGQTLDLLRGRYCRVHLTTAVSSIRLPALSRTAAAHRFLSQVAPVIEEAQSHLAPPSPADLESAADAPVRQPAGRQLPPALAPARTNYIIFILPVCMLSLGLASFAYLLDTLPVQLTSLGWMLGCATIVLAGVVAFSENRAHALVRLLAILMAVVSVVDIAASFVLLVQSAQATASGALQPGIPLHPAWLARWGPRICSAEIILGASGLAAAILTRAMEQDEQP